MRVIDSCMKFHLTNAGMFDSNNDGAINFNEFVSLWRYIDDWTKCFRSFDRDNSGNIDKGELVSALTQFGNLLSDIVNTVLNRFYYQ